MTRPRVAFVVQRYGAEIAGGSEQLCRLIAERLAGHCSCDVITTCAKDYVTWKNEYPSGETTEAGVKIIRFPVDAPRDTEVFNRLCATVFTQHTDRDRQLEWMREQGPYSSALLSFLEENHDAYDVFIFFTYLYCTTYFGLPLVKDRAILVPTAHDEPPIYLHIFDELFRLPQSFLFLTPEERDFVVKRFCLPDAAGEIAALGQAVSDDTFVETDPGAAKRIAGRAPYILYLGRIDESKGCKILIEWFQRYVTEHETSTINLVLAGKAVMPVAPHPRIILPGYVSEAVKASLIRSSLFMAVPSPYESLCISAIEAWVHETPVLANGECLVLAGQCRRSNGGLWYRNYEEFAECVSLLSSGNRLREQLGSSGRRFVEREYQWDRVEASYLRTISRITAANRPSKNPPRTVAEHA